ncbi:MAG: CcmD family protein [Puia sp.]|nr:CcmD family protein [Puia sp.]
MRKRTLLLSSASLFLFLLPSLLLAQVTDAEKKYTAFEMRSNGKIYVLVACILIIVLGLICYLVRLDGKISKLEKETK